MANARGPVFRIERELIEEPSNSLSYKHLVVLKTYYIDDEPVTREEFDSRYQQANGQQDGITP